MIYRNSSLSAGTGQSGSSRKGGSWTDPANYSLKHELQNHGKNFIFIVDL